MTRLDTYALRHPARTILAGCLLTLAAGTGLPKLELRTDGQALVPENAPEVLYDREVRDVFDVEDPIAVVIESGHPDGLWNPRTLRLLDELTQELGAVEGVDPDEVTSLATEHSQRARGRNALDFRTFLDPFPETPEDVRRVRDDVSGMRIYDGTLVSHDASAAAILVGTEPGIDRPALHRRILEAVAAHGEVPERIHVVGAPIAESYLGTYILEDLATLVPVGVVLMGFLFWLRYKSVTAVVLPMTEVGACLVFVFGIMGHAGVPVSLVVTVLPVILTAVGIVDEIHVFDRFTRTGSIRQAMDEMWRPVVKTSVTTAIAFLSFTLSPIAPVRHFGLFTALGVLFCMLWSLTVIPAGLALRRAPEPTAATAWSLGCARLGEWVLGRRRVVLAATILVLLAVPLGLWRVTVQDSWIDGFAASSPFRRSTETVNRLFHGTHLLYVDFDARPGTLAGEMKPIAAGDDGVPELLELRIPAAPGVDPAALVGEQLLWSAVPVGASGRPPRADLVAVVTAAELRDGQVRVEATPGLNESGRRFLASLPPGSWTPRASGERLLDPRLLHLVDETGDFIARNLPGGRGGVLDPYDQLAAVRYILSGGQDEARDVEERAILNRRLLSVFSRVRGPRRVEEVFDAARQRALLTVFLENANFVDVGRLMDEVRVYARAELEPLGVRIGFAGDVAVSQAMIGAIVSTQVGSLVLSLLGIFLVAAGLGRSLRTGFLCLLPPALAVLVNFAVMGLLGIPLGVATSMFSAMTIGLGVDFAIHLTERFQSLASHADRRERLRESLAVTGPAILTNALVVGAGFGVMLLSRVPANGRLGLFVVLSVTTCLVATFTVLPLLLGAPKGPAP